VIRTSALGEGIALEGDLPAGSVAYVDADWIASAPQLPVPAIVLDAEAGTVRIDEGPTLSLHGSVESDTVAGRVLLALARTAAAVADVHRPCVCQVCGGGAVALHTAALLGLAPTRSGSARTVERPHVLVETTGAPEAIIAATRLLGDLGVLVLAGEPLGRPLELDLYPDVHSRGFRVVGVRPPLSSIEARSDIAGEEPLPAVLAATLAQASFGEVLPATAAWFRVA
jgi:hypothetical protein